MTEPAYDEAPAPAAFPGIPASGRLVFRALRNGAALGTHRLEFAREADRLTVSICVDYAVKLGFITMFRYRLRGRETWAGGELVSATVDTDNDGKPAFMRAERQDAGLVVEGSAAARYRAPAGALLATHWNKAQLKGPVINPQDGTLVHFEVVSKGAAKVADSAGRLHVAERFGLAGKSPLDLWYDESGRWISLQAVVRDGSTISYLRLA